MSLALPGGRPALAERVHGHAAGAPDHARGAAEGRRAPTLVVPALEAPRVDPVPEVFSVRPWAETEDPVALVASLVAGLRRHPTLAISDRAWATFVFRLQATGRPPLDHGVGGHGTVAGGQGRARGRSTGQGGGGGGPGGGSLLGGAIKLVGQSERQVSAEMTRGAC